MSKLRSLHLLFTRRDLTERISGEQTDLLMREHIARLTLIHAMNIHYDIFIFM